jgi:hypothetical protein
MGIDDKGFLTLSPIKFVKEEKLPKILKSWLSYFEEDSKANLAPM